MVLIPLPNESELISRVKTHLDSEALTTLVNQHTGAYYTVVNKYAKAYPAAIRQDDLIGDRFFNIHRFVLDYNPEKATKLSTYIYERTDYMCRDLLKHERYNPINGGVGFAQSGAYVVEPNGDNYTSAAGNSIVLVDETEGAAVVDVADKDLKLEEILDVAACSCADRRFIEILKLRHYGKDSKTQMSWRQIGRKMNLSHEMARKIYLANIRIIRRRLNQPVLAH